MANSSRADAFDKRWSSHRASIDASTVTAPAYRSGLAHSAVAVGRVTQDSVTVWWLQPASVSPLGAGPVTVSPTGSRAGRVVLTLRDDQGLERTVQTSGEMLVADTGIRIFHWGPDTASPPLEPETRYHLTLALPGVSPFATTTFYTAPAADTRSPFSIGIVSCMQPFADDGSISTEACAVLDKLKDAYQRMGVRLVLMLGDQMYADAPPKLSLFDGEHFATIAPPGRGRIEDCSRSEVHGLYSERYRRLLGVPSLRDFLGAFPSYAVIDDHEIVDNFGSNPLHSTPAWRDLGAGALDAAHSWQTSRVIGADRPDSMHYTFEYGPTAGFMMDLRSKRRAQGRKVTVCEADQLDALEAFLESSSHPVLVVGLSIPLAHGPRWSAKMMGWMLPTGNDFMDRWTFSRGAEKRLIGMLSRQAVRHPEQVVILAGGDVHSGAVTRLAWKHRGRPTYQLTSSALANLAGPHVQLVSSWLPGARRYLGPRGSERAELQLLPGAGDASQNPLAALNAGVIEYAPGDIGTIVRLHLLSRVEDRVEPVFTSEALMGKART